MRENNFYYRRPVLSFIASENGSAARRVIDAIYSGDLIADVGMVISNNLNAPIVNWCDKNGVSVEIISSKTNPDDEDDEICRSLKHINTDLVCLSGYRKKIGPMMLDGFSKRILNIHPSLLPNHGGQGMYGDVIHASVLKSKANTTGVTIHIVNEKYDEGHVVSQVEVPVMKSDTVMSLGNRVRNAEPALYIETIQKVLTGEWPLGAPGEPEIEFTG